MTAPRDHGGALDAAIARHGGTRANWLDLSTGINPVPYPLPPLPQDVWTALPDAAATDRLLTHARHFWRVPDGAQIVVAPGASALIARLPHLHRGGGVYIPGPTYNEHAAAFETFAPGQISTDDPAARTHIYVHPNNPDGRLWPADQVRRARLTIIDESFCDVAAEQSHIALTDRPGTVILKSFGKFWGLAGLRLGFAIGTPDTLKDATVSASLTDHLGPWPVSGPALAIGARALADPDWAAQTRTRLTRDARRLDALFTRTGAQIVGGTALFRLYHIPDAARWHDALARHHILTRTFPYAPTWLRVGLPHPDGFDRLERTLHGMAGGATTPVERRAPPP